MFFLLIMRVRERGVEESAGVQDFVIPNSAWVPFVFMHAVSLSGYVSMFLGE